MADNISTYISVIIYLSIFVKSNCGIDAWNDLTYSLSAPYTSSVTVEGIERHRRDVNTTTPDANNPPQPANGVPTAVPVETTTFNDTILEDLHYQYYMLNKPLKGNEAISHWIDFEHQQYQEFDPQKHVTLSDSHRTAANIQLKFPFKFYGHDVTNITIATGGFIYVGDFLHQWLTATQYVAPLMGNFDTTLGNSSHIKYMDTGEMFVVWWQDVHLKDQEDEGHFSFQSILMKNGVVKFVYKHVGVHALNISASKHPVTVGLSDAYYIDTDISDTVRRRTIYEYHRVEIPLSQIESQTALILNLLPTCIAMSDCEMCLTSTIEFDCGWCPDSHHCSDGLDRKRQEYLQASCSGEDLKPEECPVPNNDKDAQFLPIGEVGPTTGRVSGVGIAGIIIGILLIFIIVAVIGWVVYAYTHPQSKSGLFLIEHRPANLRATLSRVKFWKRGGTSGEKYEVDMQGETNA